MLACYWSIFRPNYIIKELFNKGFYYRNIRLDESMLVYRIKFKNKLYFLSNIHTVSDNVSF